jgi:hypothetical protein
MKRLVQVAALAVALTTFASVAEAAIPPILRRPTGKPMWFMGSIGPAFWLEGGGTAGKLPLQFGYHFTGHAWGPAIAVDLVPIFWGGSFGRSTGGGGIEVLPKFVWDIPIVDGLGLFLSPSIGAGFAYLGSGYYSSGTAGATVQIAFEGKLVLGGRGFVSFRPIGVDILISGGATALWDFMFGGGVLF